MANDRDQHDIDAINEALVALRQDVPLTAEEWRANRSVLARKCRMVFESVRRTVMAARRWNFVHGLIAVHGRVRVDGRYTVTMPVPYMRILRVVDPEGYDCAGWDVFEDGRIVSTTPVASIEYIRDEPNVGRWPSAVRYAFVMALAKELAIPVTGRKADLQIYAQLAEEALRNAALQDAQATKPGPESRGRNLYADRIRGRGAR